MELKELVSQILNRIDNVNFHLGENSEGLSFDINWRETVIKSVHNDNIGEALNILRNQPLLREHRSEVSLLHFRFKRGNNLLRKGLITLEENSVILTNICSNIIDLVEEYWDEIGP